MAEDLHGYKKKLERSIERIQESSMCKDNKEALLGFYRACYAEGIKAGKLHRYLDDISRLTKDNPKKYLDYTKKEIVELFEELKNQGNMVNYQMTIPKSFAEGKRFLESLYKEEGVVPLFLLFKKK